MTTGDVQITVLDGGSGTIVVPGATVQLVIGTSSSGTAAQVVATRNPNTLVTNFGYGPLVEAAALSALSGGTILAMRAATVTAGSASSVTFVGTGSSVITVTGAPYDTYYVSFLVTTGGTIGTAGIKFKLSLDAGRNYGPTIALGTANTYAITNTNLTLNFAAGTLVAADVATFGTTQPLWDDAAVTACLTAFQASAYAISGVGSIHIVGPSAGTDASTFETNLDTMVTGFVYNRALVSSRDASPATKWGGTPESEATWTTAVEASYSAVSAKRICASAGYYNMPSAFPNPVAGSPRHRRPLSWAHAARQVTIPPQRHAGRVRDGALSNVIVDPTSDPMDGFIYHDERINPGFDGARFTSARTRVGLPGFYIVNPNLMSPLGSVFTILPLGNVMDVACGIVHQVGQQEINADIRLNASGTIYENEARAIETTLLGAINAAMVATSEISSAVVTVDRSNNILATSTVNIAVTIVARGYVLEEDVTIGFQSPFAAGA